MSQVYIIILKICKYLGLSSALNALLNCQCELFTNDIGFHQCMLVVAQGLYAGSLLALGF